MLPSLFLWVEIVFIYSNNHFRYEYHQCEGGRRRDVQVPTCPLCSAPVPGKRGEEPDIAVSEHIDNDCQADPAKERRKKVGLTFHLKNIVLDFFNCKFLT